MVLDLLASNKSRTPLYHTLESRNSLLFLSKIEARIRKGERTGNRSHERKEIGS